MRKYAIFIPVVAVAALWGAPVAHAGDDIRITVTIGDDQVTEGTDAQAVVSVDLSAPAPVGGICIEVTEVEVTASAGEDYKFKTIDFSFAEGDQTANAHIDIVNDDILEPDETFDVQATQIACTQDAQLGISAGISAAVIVDTTDTGTVTIFDDDEGPITGSSGTLVWAGLGALGLGAIAVGAARVRRRPQTA